MLSTKSICLSITAIITAVLASSASDPPTFRPPTLPPKLTPLFTIITRAKDYQTPVPLLTGGFQTLYPIVGGDISGPALNGTVTDGLAAPRVTDDGVYAHSIRRFYGRTADGEDFWIEQKGVGHYTREQTWLTITIGGDYEYLQHVFLLAQNDVNVAARTDKITVYGVNLQDQGLAA